MKTIDHDPNEFKKKGLFGLSAGELGGVFAVSLVLVVGRHGLPPVYPGDIVALGIVGAMFWWFSRPSNKTGAHESAGQGIAFRLGKSLNRIRGRLRRGA